MRELEQNKEINILATDSGNATVQLEYNDYDNKIEVLLNESIYILINTDTSTHLKITTKIKIKGSLKDADTKQELLPRRSVVGAESITASINFVNKELHGD